jgi:hypothetical protein
MQLLQMVTSMCLGFDHWGFGCCRMVVCAVCMRCIARQLGRLVASTTDYSGCACSWFLAYGMCVGCVASVGCVQFGGLVLVVFILGLVQVYSSQVGAGAHKVL